jgi:hypothetical protein
VRPGRDNIAAPDLPDDLVWIGERPDSMPALTAGGPAIVHFFDFAQLNSVRALPYVLEWRRRYAPLGLTVLGVHSPRFRFTAEHATMAAGVDALGIEHPVADDSGYGIWHDYGCRGWPSLFLWARGGSLAWAHFGEGEYRATEEAIQAELREQDALRDLPSPLAPLRATDAPGARVMAPSPEVFPGGSWERPWTAGEDGEELVLPYEAGSAHATLEGNGELAIELDGEALEPLEIAGPALYDLAEHPRHGSHALVLRPSPGLRVWSVSFAAGVP